MIKFLKRLLGLESKSAPEHGKEPLPQHNVNPVSKSKKPTAPKNSPAPKKAEKKKPDLKTKRPVKKREALPIVDLDSVTLIDERPKKRGRPAKPKA